VRGNIQRTCSSLPGDCLNSSILVVQDQSLFFFGTVLRVPPCVVTSRTHAVRIRAGSKVHDQFTKVEWMEGEVEKHCTSSSQRC